jgi:hypothetical protein
MTLIDSRSILNLIRVILNCSYFKLFTLDFAFTDAGIVLGRQAFTFLNRQICKDEQYKCTTRN